jgi:hypothetical protein
MSDTAADELPEKSADAKVLEQIKGLPTEIGLRILDMHAGLRHREYEATCALQRISFENVGKAGASAINIGLVINGGAAVAVLALAGHLAAAPTSLGRFAVLIEPLCYFSAGVFINAIARGADYFGAASVLHKRNRRQRFFYCLTIVLVTLCLVAFPLGCWRTAAALFSLSIP